METPRQRWQHAADLAADAARLMYAGHSRVSARHPTYNEDRHTIDGRRGLVAVFDGVGGSVAGGVAAQIAARSLRHGWRRFLRHTQPAHAHDIVALGQGLHVTDIYRTLVELLETAHGQIHVEGPRNKLVQGGRTATTVAAAVFCRSRRVRGYTLVYAWVGDSRIYLVRRTQALTCLTADDSLLTRLVQSGTITPSAAARIDQATDSHALSDVERTRFNWRNIITQSLGDPTPPEIHVGRRWIAPGDSVLLCTDGIHDNLTARDIGTILQQRFNKGVVRELISAAYRQASRPPEICLRAKPDDMTAIVVSCVSAAE